jgi:rod shape-determining protein MreC
LQGVLRGTPLGEVVLEKVMSDETVQPGEKVVTSGGDRIFPKGLPVGTVTKVSPGAELFLNIRVKPAADLGRLEEVLVITQQEEKSPASAEGVPPMRAADILAQRLPSVPDRPPDDPNKPPPPTSGLKIFPAPNTPAMPTPAGSPKPSRVVAGDPPAQTLATQRPSGPGSTATVTTPKAHVYPAGSANNSGSASSPIKPNENSSVAKPITPLKPTAPAVKATSDNSSQPASPKAEPATPPAIEPPPQEQPQ